MSSAISPRTIRRWKRKQIVVERQADLPDALLVEDGRHLVQRNEEDFPTDQYFDIVPANKLQKRVSSKQYQELHTQYEETNALDNQNDQLELEEVVVPHIPVISTVRNMVCPSTPGMPGVPEEFEYREINPVSLKIAALATRHGLSNSAIDDILKFASEVAMFHRDSIPKCMSSVDNDLCSSRRFQVSFFWKCECCGQIKEEQAFESPFKAKCCGTAIQPTADHYITFNVRQVLATVMPIVQTHINLEKLLLLRPKLRKQREMLNFNNEDFSVTLNVDGVCLTNGSKCVIHPVLGYIDGTSARCSDDNIMFGFWIGQKGGKPDFKILFQHVIESFKELKSNGVRWKREDGSEVISRTIISTCLCDSVERPLVQGLMQWNAEYGCSYCLHQEPGHYFTPAGTCSGMRSCHQYKSICVQLDKKNEIVTFGIRHRSPFLELDYFDPILDFPPCIMHAGYLGVAKTMTEGWIQNRAADKIHISSAQITKIDRYMAAIKPPIRVSRKPRPLKYLPWFKAHELCMWLFYYSPPILNLVLDSPIFKHWLLLVRGLSLVLRADMSHEHIKLAAKDLYNFWLDTFSLYGHKMCHYNFHLITHLPALAKELGPMFLYSMSPFETYNMKIKSFLKSSQHMGEQIARRYVRDLLVKSVKHVTKSRDDLSWHARRKGEENWYQCLVDRCDVEYFSRIINSDGRRFYSLSHSKTKIRNSCCFFINSEQVIEVEYFVKVPCNANNLAVGSVYSLTEVFNLWYFFQSICEESATIPVKLLGDIAMKISCEGSVYFTHFINDTECYNE